MFLNYRGLYCSWRCLHHRAWAASWHVCTTEACAVPGGVCHRAWAAAWRVCTTEACAVPGNVYTTDYGESATPRIINTRSRWLPVSLIRGVIFQIGISPRICSQNRNGSNSNIRDPCRTIYAKMSGKPVHCHVHLIYCRRCSLRFENNLLTVRVRFASKIIFLLSNVFALLRK